MFRYFLIAALSLSLAANGFALYRIHQLQVFATDIADRESSDDIAQNRRLSTLESQAPTGMFAATPPKDFSEDIDDLQAQSSATKGKLTRLCEYVHGDSCYANY